MISLVENELIKLLGKRRLLVIMALMVILISMFTYAQFRENQRTKQRLGTTDWRATLQQSIIDSQNRLNNTRISEEWKKQVQIRITQQQYYLDHDINPNEPGGPTFLRLFIENSIQLFLPLMTLLVAADIVSSEYSAGTIKLLLTRPVKRWRILLSKYLTLVLIISLIILMFTAFTYLISGSVFGFRGWQAPILTGFNLKGGELDTTAVHLIAQWKYILMEAGLAWFVALVVATLSFMLSVLVRSTAAGMGVMLAFLIGGNILRNMVASWESAKYLFMVNLDLTGYLAGMAPPIEGMSLGFSLSVLATWALVGLFISFWAFTRKDVY